MASNLVIVKMEEEFPLDIHDFDSKTLLFEKQNDKANILALLQKAYDVYTNTYEAYAMQDEDDPYFYKEWNNLSYEEKVLHAVRRAISDNSNDPECEFKLLEDVETLSFDIG